jgi:hypothetical protein
MAETPHEIELRGYITDLFAQRDETLGTTGGLPISDAEAEGVIRAAYTAGRNSAGAAVSEALGILHTIWDDEGNRREGAVFDPNTIMAMLRSLEATIAP